MIDGSLLIVTSSPGIRDTIYVGYAERCGEFIILSKASMIVRYVEVGVAGIASEPEKATVLRPVTALEGKVIIPISGIASMVVADPACWDSHLGVSRG